jgi:hypothetical protein
VYFVVWLDDVYLHRSFPNIYTPRRPVHLRYPCISLRPPLTSPANVSGGGEKRIFPPHRLQVRLITICSITISMSAQSPSSCLLNHYVQVRSSTSFYYSHLQMHLSTVSSCVVDNRQIDSEYHTAIHSFKGCRQRPERCCEALQKW